MSKARKKKAEPKKALPGGLWVRLKHGRYNLAKNFGLGCLLTIQLGHQKKTGSHDAVISPGTNLFFYSLETPAKRCTHIRETRLLTNY